MTASGRRWLAAPWHGRPIAADAARFLLAHPGDSAALAALSLRDVLASGPMIRAADPSVTTSQELWPFLARVFLDRPWTRPPGCSTSSGDASCAVA